MTNARKIFRLTLIKPSHYDHDGYVIQWLRSSMPSNSLAVVYGLAMDCARRQVLGPHTDIVVSAHDETNTRIRPERLARDLRAAGGGMVGMVGVQSNQFPRAMDLARRFRALGIPVAIGGFHVSGTLAMLPGITPELQEAIDLGITLFAGEAEERLEELLRDAAGGTVKPVYNHMARLPNLAGVPIPFLPAAQLKRTAGKMTTFDAGRGCPFQCSFCTIINVQGRVSRRRTPDDVEAIVRQNVAQGVHSFFITDDNFARNKDWEPIFDRLIALREGEGIRLKCTIQVDTLCHRIPRFIDKAGRAGVVRVFIGLESIHPESLWGAKKKQNRITEYQQMLLAWKGIRAVIWAAYIIGFPADTPESVMRDIRIIQRELPIDFLEFFVLTPLPGSEDHQKLALAGVDMDADLNRYDTFHVVTAHAPRDVGNDLLGGVAELLHPGAYGDTDAPGGGHGNLARQDGDHAPELLGAEPGGAHASAGRRVSAAQSAHGAATRPWNRADLAVLAGLYRRRVVEARADGRHGGTAAPPASPAEAQSRGATLPRPGADAGRGVGHAGPAHRCRASGSRETAPAAATGAPTHAG
jgi:hypothetical protein